MFNLKSFLLILMSAILLTTSGMGYARHAEILIDANNGKILHEMDATHPWYPASLTKVMTLYMTFTALGQGRIGLQDSMKASHHASRQPNSKLGLRPGQTITVEEAILAIITRSANDASVVLAEYIGGNEENFAAKMTAKAHSIGMYDTHFMNATGLPHQWQVTTPRDLALLAYRVYKEFPQYYRYFSAHSFYYHGRDWPGINKFTASYLGAEGMKTGFTCGSGYNLMSSAQQEGRRFIGVVLGGMTSAERYRLMVDMMDKGFAHNFDDNAGKLVSAMPAKSIGTAPYQLDCGKGAIAKLTNHFGGEGDSSISHSRKTHKLPYKSASKLTSKSKTSSKLKKSTRTKLVSKNKVVSKSKANYKKASSIKSKATSKSSTSKKVKLAAAHKPSKKRYHRSK